MSESKSTQQPIYKKWWFWAAIVLVTCVIGGAISGSNKDAQKVGENSNETSTSETSDDDNSQKTFKVGDIIAIESQEMTITSVDRNWNSSNQFVKPAEGKEYIKVNITLTNKSDDKMSYLSNAWKIEDKDGALENAAVVVGNDDNLTYGEITAGGKKAGSLIFEVPAGDTNLKIHYGPSLWSGREAIIEL